MLIIAAFNCLSWWRISSKGSLDSYLSLWSRLPGKLFILMCLFEVFIRMATPPPLSWVLFLLPSTYFHVVTDLLSHFPLWLFKDFSPNFLNLFLLPSHTTSLFLSRQLHFCLPSFFTVSQLAHSFSRSINQHSNNNNNNNSNNHCYDLPYWIPIRVSPCPWKTQCEDVA